MIAAVAHARASEREDIMWVNAEGLSDIGLVETGDLDGLSSNRLFVDIEGGIVGSGEPPPSRQRFTCLVASYNRRNPMYFISPMLR